MKYIVEADEHVQMISLIAVREGTAIMITGNIETFQTADKALEEAYHKGFEAGQHEVTTMEYQQGLDEAWECAKKIFGYETYGGLPLDELRNVFGVKGVPFCTADILRTNTASEALAKIKAYEEQQEQNRRIMFGDKLLTKKDHLYGVALSNEVNGSVYVWREDCVAYESSPQEWRKTGENIPQVAELLKAMKEGAE